VFTPHDGVDSQLNERRLPAEPLTDPIEFLRGKPVIFSKGTGDRWRLEGRCRHEAGDEPGKG